MTWQSRKRRRKAILIGDNLISAQMFLTRSQMLQEAGYDVKILEWVFHDRNEMNRQNLRIERLGPEAEPPPKGLLTEVHDAQILITHFAPVPRKVIIAGKQLQVIGVARGGYENVNIQAATESNIPVVNIMGRNANAVAEYTIGLILCEMRNIARSHIAIKQGEWYNRSVEPLGCFELAGKTVGLIGFGSVGQLVARRLSGFEVHLLVFDPWVSASLIHQMGAESVDLETLLRESDVISLHARLTPENRNLLGERELLMMKPNAYLINTARAGLVDQKALEKVLRERRIAGAAFDVFWEEPLPTDSPFVRLDNITLSSHLAGTTIESLNRSVELVIHGVLDYLQRGNSSYIVNREVLIHV